jgi:hypothetical protein
MRRALTWGVAVAVSTAVFVVQHGGVSAFGGTDSSSYRFMATQPNAPGQPVTYSSCKPIRVEFNLSGVEHPDVARTVLLQALGEASAASHLNMSYVGDSRRIARWPDPTLTIEGGAWPVLVGFARPADVPQLRGAAGVGGSFRINRAGTDVYVTGEIALDTDYFNLLLNAGDTAQAKAIVMHELGHVLGLGHVKDDHELMNAHGRDMDDYGPGDLRGLALLGKGPCI